jgi:hypothetical protein
MTTSASRSTTIAGKDVTLVVKRDQHGAGLVTVRVKSAKSPGAVKAKDVEAYLVGASGFVSAGIGPRSSTYHFQRGLSDAVLGRLVGFVE